MLIHNVSQPLSKRRIACGALGILGACASGLSILPAAIAQSQIQSQTRAQTQTQTTQVIAQVNNADYSCYLHSSEGREYDLSALCNGFQPQARPQEVVLQTGDVQVTLRWDSTDDLDLFVRGPSGEQVSYFNPSISSGGQLDVDANAGCAEAMAAPVENIFWPTGEGVVGDYVVTVDLYSRCGGSSGPVNFTLDTLVRGEVQTRTGTVSDQETSVDFPFTFSE